jgi:hypothetical protein
MTRTLEIPAELESALQVKAQQLGLPIESYVIEVLRHETETNGAVGKWSRAETQNAEKGH